MLGLISFLVASRLPAYTITRDAFGVAMVRAATEADAYQGMGRAVAEDRLWQMELSRRSARGRLSEIAGDKAIKSDREVLRRAYTDGELRAQFDALPAEVRTGFEAYAKGVDEAIADRTAKGTLPPGYAEAGFAPEPWTVLDSCAIAVSMARVFGTGGAGELRNLALLRYLDTQPCKTQKLDVFDDIAWINDQSSPTTVADEDDTVKPRPSFPNPTRARTEAQLAAMPTTNLFELAGAISGATFEDSRLLAETLAVPFKAGSYAVVVSPKKSATGAPILLGAPQMGHTVPSVVHEVALEGGGLHVAGMDIPGIPGVVIGHNRDLAWTLTSGVADLEDVVYSRLEGDLYVTKGRAKTVERIEFSLSPKGKPESKVVQERTTHGPVLLKSMTSKALFSLRSSLWKSELSMGTSILRIGKAKGPSELREAVSHAATSFNVFYACRSGDVGYQYAGRVPLRNPSTDPRLPCQDTPEDEWRGFIPFAQMPHVENPRSGLIFNWNNKPVKWWSNGDTPVWGSIFRSSVLGEALGRWGPILDAGKVERAVWEIARRNTSSNGAFASEFGGFVPLSGYDGWEMDGSLSANAYNSAVRELRKQLFAKAIGNLTGDALFEQAVQPSVIRLALDGKTKYDFLAGRDKKQVVLSALQSSEASLVKRFGPDRNAWGFKAGAFPVGAGLEPVPYANRGTYMQVVELGATVRGRNVVVPGVAEAGPHASDQVPLSRAWTYKQMWPLP